MTAYDVVFSKQASMHYMQKEAGVGSIIKGIAKGIQRARQQRAMAKQYKKMQKFKALHADRVSRANATRAASDATLNDAVAQSGWRNLAGNIKGSRQAAKADDLQALANDAEKAFIRRQMEIEKLLVAQGATKAQARAITRNVNAQKYLQHGDADGAMKLQAIRDRRLQAVADGRARQQAAQTVQPAVQATQPSAQAAAQSAAKATKPAAQATQPAAQAANNALNGGGGFQVTLP